MKIFKAMSVVAITAALVGCAHGQTSSVEPEDAAKLDRKLVKDAVVFDPGTKDKAVVPEIAAPGLRAVFVARHLEGPRHLVGEHVDWFLDGDVSILETESQKQPQVKEKKGIK